MKNTCIVLLSFMLLSCGRKIDLKFPKEIDYFNESFVNFFPEKVPLSYSKLIVSQDITHSHPYVWLKFYEGKEEISKLTLELEKNAIATYVSEDTCILSIDKHLNSQNWFRFDKNSRTKTEKDFSFNPCSKSNFPVPNFFEEGWGSSDNGLIGLEGYILYVIDAKSGLFMDSTKLPNGRYTPEGWKHGYSKGVAINSKLGVVIYWADIW
ncbi:hypothetical protein JYB64_19380 [Algoriphagus aestuarii]|nr:hypothetical protein [Algoriphagus aestuarii]